MDRRSLYRYVLLGAVIVLAAYGLVLKAVFWAHVLRLPHVGELSSLGQVCLDAVLLPVVVIGFVLTLWQLRKALELAQRDLYWADEDRPDKVTKAITLSPPTESRKLALLPVAVLNTARPVAKWFLVEFLVPRDFCEEKRTPETEHIVGTSGHGGIFSCSGLSNLSF